MKQVFICFLTLVLLSLATLIKAQDILGNAETNFALGNFSEAVELYESTELINATISAEDMYRKGIAYLYTDQVEEAIMTLEELYVIYPEYQESYLVLAGLYRKVGEVDKAKKVYTAYEKFDPVLSNHYIMSLDWAEENASLSNVTVSPMKVNINSEKNEYFPVQFRDDIIFTSNREGYRVSENNKKNGQSDQLFTTYTSSPYEWAIPHALRSDIENWDHNVMISFSPDYNRALLTVSSSSTVLQNLHSSDNNLSVYIADINEHGRLTNMKSFPYNSIDYSTGFATFASDNQTIYFACNRNGGYGGYDIYETKLENDKWSNAKNVGYQINTVGNEIAPMLIDNNLFFSSDLRFGFGGYDIFYSPKKIDGMFEVAVNAGLGINSSSEEIAYNEINGNKYVSSSRNSSQGGVDIFYLSPLEENSSPRVLSTSLNAISRIDKMSTSLMKLQESKLEVKRVEIPKIELQEMKTSNMEEVDNELTYKNDFSSTSLMIPISDNLTPVELSAMAVSKDGHNVNMYSVQVAVLSNLSERDVERFQRTLSDIDDVYKIYFQDQIKIRVGSYESNFDAVKTLNLVKARGYSDAFVVIENVIVSAGEEFENVHEETTSETNKSTNSSYNFVDIGKGEYKVRLATYTNPKWFNGEQVARYGNVQRVDRKDWTMFLLGDYKRIEDAERVRVKAIELGFKQAHIVRMENDIPVRVTQ